MKSNYIETLRIRLYSYYEKYKNFKTIDHFISEKEKKFLYNARVKNQKKH